MEQRLNVESFIQRWQDSGAAERANYQLFLSELCDLLGVARPDPSKPDDEENVYVFERSVTFHHPDGSTSTGRVDLYKRGCFSLEAKQGVEKKEKEAMLSQAAKVKLLRAKKGTAQRGTAAWNEAMLKARGQTEQYARALPASEGRPPFLVVVDAGHSIELYSEFTRSNGCSIRSSKHAIRPAKRGVWSSKRAIRSAKRAIRPSLRLRRPPDPPGSWTLALSENARPSPQKTVNRVPCPVHSFAHTFLLYHRSMAKTENAETGSNTLNRSLSAARATKQDEFYTQLPDIEKELRHYTKHFEGKTVLCNCDDPRVSNFFHFFTYNFEKLKLKKLITTCYKNQNADLFSTHASEKGVYLEYSGDKNGSRVPDPAEIGVHNFKGDGDFRSNECIALLKEADIVVTNPPFSLFREYVEQLVKYDKKFLMIGNTNAITYKDIFELIKEDRIRTGYTNFNVGMFFGVPDDWEHFHHVDKDGKKIARVAASCWFTNMEVEKHKELLPLYKKYNSDEYPSYDNYSAIEVSRYTDIPADYDGAMGVPITFVDKYNPAQFEILGLSGTSYPTTKNYGKKERVVDGVRMKSNTGTLGCVVRVDSFGAGTHFDVGYPVKGIYRRLFIRRKEQTS